jgi:hypothetical protein
MPNARHSRDTVFWGKEYFNAKGVSILVAVSVFPDEL